MSDFSKEVLFFPRGIPGFESEHHFQLIQEQDHPLAQLVSDREENLGFALVRAQAFFPDYLGTVEIDEEAAALLKAENDKNIEVWAILTLSRKDLGNTTVNLKAPILINRNEKIGLQFILSEEKYLARTPLFTESSQDVQASEGAIG